MMPELELVTVRPPALIVPEIVPEFVTVKFAFPTIPASAPEIVPELVTIKLELEITSNAPPDPVDDTEPVLLKTALPVPPAVSRATALPWKTLVVIVPLLVIETVLPPSKDKPSPLTVMPKFTCPTRGAFAKF